jgi:hypothetical protein
MSEFMQHVEKQEWTQEKPTVDGYYWVKWVRGAGERTTIAEVIVLNDWASLPGLESPFFINRNTDDWWWLGPIAAPDPPEIASN